MLIGCLGFSNDYNWLIVEKFMIKIVVVLLFGGLDFVIVVAIVKREGYWVIVFFFNYG